MENFLRTSPIVYCVGEKYVITVPVLKPTLAWVRVGDKEFYDHSCGILRSDVTVHKIEVPQAVLDREGGYTVCLREVLERKPYFPKVGEVMTADFDFCPVKGGRVSMYHVADAHGDTVHTVGACRRFEEQYGKIDLLVLNGDIIDHSGRVENFDAIHTIAAEISGGRIPVICSRGNHDLRGACAEKLADYMPNAEGKTYYTFRVGGVWGLVLDCAEDKNDDHAEYGSCNVCHSFRLEETEFLRRVAQGGEYDACGAEHKIVIAHNPFTMKFPEPFNIEEELYGEWVDVLNTAVKPDMLISGHKHYFKVIKSGDPEDAYGQSFPTVIASVKDHKTCYFAGTGIIFDGKTAKIVVTDEKGVVS